MVFETLTAPPIPLSTVRFSSNYRPITVIFSRLFETFVATPIPSAVALVAVPIPFAENLVAARIQFPATPCPSEGSTIPLTFKLPLNYR